MENNIAYCGLDCEKCDARKATLNNDDALREKTAQLWTELNGVEITKEMINCVGCRAEGVKTPFCESLCEIRKCAAEKKCDTCGDCDGWEKCEKLKMITGSNSEAAENLKKKEADIPGIPIGMCLGLSLGVAIGSALNNLALWMSLGLCIGMCLGVLVDRKGKDD